MNLSPDSKFFVLCGKLVDLVKINLLWLLCCLPVVTIGASTTAMVTCLYAFREGSNCGGKVFFSAFRKSFGTATIAWLLMAFLGIMLVLDYVIVAGLNFPGRMAVIVLIFFLLFALVLVAGMIFPLLSQFPSKLKELAINAVLLCIANLPKMLLVTAMNLLPVLLFLLLPKVFVLLGFVFILCGFSLMGLYDINVLEKIFAQFRK